MIIECGLNATMEMQPRMFHAKNWLYLQSKQGNRICIDLNTGELVKGQCHKAPGLSKTQIAQIVQQWNNQ